MKHVHLLIILILVMLLPIVKTYRFFTNRRKGYKKAVYWKRHPKK